MGEALNTVGDRGFAYRILTDDAPAMWLYELRNAFGVSNSIEPGHIRADAWWANLADWSVVAGR